MPQEKRDPCGHGAGAEGKAGAVYDPEEEDHKGAGGEQVTRTGGGHEKEPGHREAVFAYPVDKAPHGGTAEEGAQVHHAAHHTHEGRAGSKALGKAGDERRHQHGARKIKEAGYQKKQYIF